MDIFYFQFIFFDTLNNIVDLPTDSIVDNFEVGVIKGPTVKNNIPTYLLR